MQRECVRWRGEFMSLGVDERSPSRAEASEMTEGWREWQGLTRTAATKRDERDKTQGWVSVGVCQKSNSPRPPVNNIIKL